MAPSHLIVLHPFTLGLIRFKARQLCRRGDFCRHEREDLEQAMRLYLLERAHRFDPARGSVEAFITHLLKTWVAMELRYRKRDKRADAYRAVSLAGTPVPCDGDITCLGAMLLEADAHRRHQLDPVSSSEQLDLRDAVDHVTRHLDPSDQTLVASVVENGITATARAWGISWRQVAKALARVSREFEKAGAARVVSGARRPPRHR